jgi:uncharacterized membrane protein required for colicin V production
MSILDLVLAAILALAFFSGLKKGLIRSLGRIFGLIIGAYVASHFYLDFFSWGKDLVSANEAVGKVLAFIILFIVVIQITHLIFYLIEKAFNLLAIVPGSKYINNLLGAALGVLESSLFLGMIFYIASRYLSFSDKFAQIVEDSLILPWLNLVVEMILPILPQALKAIQSLI